MDTNEYFERELEIINEITDSFDYDSEEKIVLSSHLLNRYGYEERVIMLDVTCSDKHVKTSDMDQVIDNAVHLNLECMANETNCPNTYNLNTIQLMLQQQ